MLKAEQLTLGYGPVVICRDLNIEIEEGEAVALLGRNGMGKTTLLEGLLGMNKQSGGRILFRGEDISERSIHDRARLGLGLVPQGRRIFPDITVKDNLRLGALAAANRRRKSSVPDMIFDYFPILEERLDQQAQTLSGGEQQMLAIARALLGEPEILLFDEPSEGLAPKIVDTIAGLIRLLAEEGMTILLAEQNLNFALEVTTRGYVLEKGQIVTAGPNQTLQDNEIVRDYLLL